MHGRTSLRESSSDPVEYVEPSALKPGYSSSTASTKLDADNYVTTNASGNLDAERYATFSATRGITLVPAETASTLYSSRMNH